MCDVANLDRGWVYVNAGSPIKVMVRVMLVTEPDNINSDTCRIFLVRYGWILKGEWTWEANPKLPLDVYKCITSKETKVISWKRFDARELFPSCIELTPGKVEVYWGL